MRHRPNIRFASWMPVARDQAIGYRYISPGTGRIVQAANDRWMRAKHRIAASAVASGQTIFEVYGGVGDHRWERLVSVSQEDADAFFQEAIKGGAFTLKGTYEKAKKSRARRLARRS